MVDIATKIEREYQLSQECASNAVSHAIECGRLLIFAKEHGHHGTWIKWLRDNVTFSESTAKRYMDTYRNRSRVSDMPSMRAALKFLAEERKPPKIKEPVTIEGEIVSRNGDEQVKPTFDQSRLYAEGSPISARSAYFRIEKEIEMMGKDDPNTIPMLYKLKGVIDAKLDRLKPMRGLPNDHLQPPITRRSSMFNMLALPVIETGFSMSGNREACHRQKLLAQMHGIY